jgi:flagellar biosynthesis GTPase FlhF
MEYMRKIVAETELRDSLIINSKWPCKGSCLDTGLASERNASLSLVLTIRFIFLDEEQAGAALCYRYAFFSLFFYKMSQDDPHDQPEQSDANNRVQQSVQPNNADHDAPQPSRKKESKKQKRQKDYLRLLRLFLKKELERREKQQQEKQEWMLTQTKLAQFHKTTVQLLTMFANSSVPSHSTSDDLDTLANKYIHNEEERHTLEFVSLLMFYTKIINYVHEQSDHALNVDNEQKMREKVILHYTLNFQNLQQQYKQLHKHQ